jgi:small subunit ribosomal protein S6
MIIVAPDVSEDELPGVIDRVGGFITTAGGNVTDTLRESPWGRRRLAYAIRHGGRDVRDGFYTVYHFDAPPPAIADIERELLLTDQVMRFLVTHFTPQPISAQPEEETEGAEAETGEEVAAEAAEAPIVAEESATVAPEAEETTTEEPTAEESTAEAVQAEVESEKEAPAKKPATRRKKAAPAEEVETTAEPTDE